jgi:hypothetical protein
MAGRKQHYIPQCLLKGFKTPGRGKTVKVWVFKKGQQPYVSSIEDVAAERYFYSGLSKDSSLNLDDQITQYENKLSELINKLYESPVGSIIDSSIAAEVITHLTIRVAHLRDIFGISFNELIDDSVEIFSDKKLIRSLMGIDNEDLPQQLQKQIEEKLSEYPLFEKPGLPKPVLLRIMFTLMKENFDNFYGDDLPIILTCLNNLASKMKNIVRTEHAKALADDLKPNERITGMSQLIWTISEFPEGDLILPDCVAVSMLRDGMTFDPYMISSIDEINVVLLPICATKLLIGRRADTILPNIQGFNEIAAICSHTFFVGAHRTPLLENLATRISERSRVTLLESLYCGFNEAIAQSIMAEYGSKFVFHSMEKRFLPETNMEVDIDCSEKREIYNSHNLSYPVNFLDCADRETAQEIAVAVNDIVSEMGHFIPLNRLEFITFAKDYISALQDIDRGFPTSKPLVPTDSDFGVGIAMTPMILRDGVVKVCIVLQAWLGHALICEDIKAQSIAIHTLAGRLAHVACIELIDRNLPGILTSPIEDDWDAWLFNQMFKAFTAYYTARISAGLNPIISSGYRDILITVLERMQEAIPRERLAYRVHGDLHHFLEIAISSIGLMMTYAGTLLGHYDGLCESIFDDEGDLMQSMEKSGLKAWANIFRRDLDRLFNRIGKWESIQELLTLNRHIERVLWQFGVFPWRNDQGQVRVEIPLFTDAAQLMKGILTSSIP